jgi:outer membrane autotransporter protein
MSAQSIDLGTASDFAVLAGSGITNTGPTTIIGDIGTFPTTTQTGFSSITQTGTNHVGDAVTQQAKIDLVTAYNVAAGLTANFTISTGELGGLTLPPGIYSAASSLGLTGVVTLNAAGDPNAVWVFQIGSTLITASNSSVLLINGAQACHVFWQVGSSATLGTGTRFAGTIMASDSITANTGATTIGRLLALNGAVTLDTNTIALAICKALVTDTETTGNGTNPNGTGRPSVEQLKNTLILAAQLVNVSTLPGLTSIYTQGFAQFDTQVFSLQQRFADLRTGSRSGRETPPVYTPSFPPSGKNPWSGKSGSGKSGSGKDGRTTEGVLPDEVNVQSPDENRMGFFITGTGDSTTAGEANSFDGTTIGTSLGVDWRLNDHWVTGISIGYSHSRSDLMPVGKVKADGAKAALYAHYQRGGFYTEGLVGGGYNSYDIERSAFLGTARGSTNGAQFDAYVGMGYDIIREGWTVTPMVSFLYTMVGIEGYNEIGSLVPLKIESQHASSLRIRIGPRVAHTSQWGIASVTPSFSAQWQHEFLDDELPFEARFSNDPGNLFTVYGPRIGRDSVLITAALNVSWKRYAAYIAYQADLGRENYERQTALVGFRVNW